jgi:phenylacetic acid degradation protein
VVPAGMHVPPRTLVAGAPATVRKSLEGASADWIRDGGRHYVELSRRYLAEGVGQDRPYTTTRENSSG